MVLRRLSGDKADPAGLASYNRKCLLDHPTYNKSIIQVRVSGARLFPTKIITIISNCNIHDINDICHAFVMFLTRNIHNDVFDKTTKILGAWVAVVLCYAENVRVWQLTFPNTTSKCGHIT